MNCYDFFFRQNESTETHNTNNNSPQTSKNPIQNKTTSVGSTQLQIGVALRQTTETSLKEISTTQRNSLPIEVASTPALPPSKREGDKEISINLLLKKIDLYLNAEPSFRVTGISILHRIYYQILSDKELSSIEDLQRNCAEKIKQVLKSVTKMIYTPVMFWPDTSNPALVYATANLAMNIQLLEQKKDTLNTSSIEFSELSALAEETLDRLEIPSYARKSQTMLLSHIEERLKNSKSEIPASYPSISSTCREWLLSKKWNSSKQLFEGNAFILLQKLFINNIEPDRWIIEIIKSLLNNPSLASSTKIEMCAILRSFASSEKYENWPLQELERLAEDSNKNVRQKVAYTIGKIGTTLPQHLKWAKEKLAFMSKDSNEYVYTEALSSINKIGTLDLESAIWAKDLFKVLLKSPDENVQRKIVFLVGSFGINHLNLELAQWERTTFERLAEDSTPSNRARLISCIAAFNSAYLQLVDKEKMLTDNPNSAADDLLFRKKSLANITLEWTKKILEKLLKDPDILVQKCVVGAICSIGTVNLELARWAKEELRSVKDEVRLTEISAICKLGTAHPELFQGLKEELENALDYCIKELQKEKFLDSKDGVALEEKLSIETKHNAKLKGNTTTAKNEDPAESVLLDIITSILNIALKSKTPESLQWASEKLKSLTQNLTGNLQIKACSALIQLSLADSKNTKQIKEILEILVKIVSEKDVASFINKLAETVKLDPELTNSAQEIFKKLLLNPDFTHRQRAVTYIKNLALTQSNSEVIEWVKKTLELLIEKQTDLSKDTAAAIAKIGTVDLKHAAWAKELLKRWIRQAGLSDVTVLVKFGIAHPSHVEWLKEIIDEKIKNLKDQDRYSSASMMAPAIAELATADSKLKTWAMSLIKSFIQDSMNYYIWKDIISSIFTIINKYPELIESVKDILVTASNSPDQTVQQQAITVIGEIGIRHVEHLEWTKKWLEGRMAYPGSSSQIKEIASNAIVAIFKNLITI